MRQENDTLAHALGHINPAYIAEAEIPALTAAASCPCRPRRERRQGRVWESGWFAAAVSGLVAIVALAAIILAGQRDPRPPVGTDVPRPPVTEPLPDETEPPTEAVKIPHTIPEGFTVTVKNVKVSAGAGFIVVLTGDILTMPGLPKVPAAERIDVDENGKITGLF